jgi:hypothetical protein
VPGAMQEHAPVCFGDQQRSGGDSHAWVHSGKTEMNAKNMKRER